jgi:FkbM family methyltransferase
VSPRTADRLTVDQRIVDKPDEESGNPHIFPASRTGPAAGCAQQSDYPRSCCHASADRCSSTKKPMFVSYAQNFEDVMLHRVFDSTPHGFYVDVGAWHPDLDSVTKHFYQAGWSGINIEPSRYYFEILKKRRTRDTNLNVAVGCDTGDRDFVEVAGSGLSSLREDAVSLARQHGFSSRRYKVPVVTLQSICEQYCRDKSISFLKIDAEGLEEEVLESLDWRRYRPVVVVVEAVHAQTMLPMWDSWEPILLRAGYLFVWFDGLNRYYLRHEDDELKKHFLVPPGFFDGFIINAGHPLSMPLGTRIRLFSQEILPSRAYNLLAKVYASVKG